MDGTRANPSGPPPARARYEIRVGGHLDDRWAEALAGVGIRRDDDGTTLLTGPALDQAALHGLLKRVRDLGLPLLSVVRSVAGPTPPDQEGTPRP